MMKMMMIRHRDALTPRCSSTEAIVPWTPGTSCSRSASSVRPCPWWRVHWDPWLQPHPPCRKSRTGWRVRLHRKINKDGLKVAIRLYAVHERWSCWGWGKRGNSAPRGRKHLKFRHIIWSDHLQIHSWNTANANRYEETPDGTTMKKALIILPFVHTVYWSIVGRIIEYKCPLTFKSQWVSSTLSTSVFSITRTLKVILITIRVDVLSSRP